MKRLDVAGGDGRSSFRVIIKDERLLFFFLEACEVAVVLVSSRTAIFDKILSIRIWNFLLNDEGSAALRKEMLKTATPCSIFAFLAGPKEGSKNGIQKRFPFNTQCMQ